MKQRQNSFKNNTLFTRFGAIAKRVIGELPIIGIFTKFLGKKIRWLSLKARIKYRSKKMGLSVDKIYQVDPNRIVFCTPLEVSPLKQIGTVAGGNWDKTDIKFEELDIFQAMKKRYLENGEWTHTVFYKNILQKIDNGETLWSCRSEKDLITRLQTIDQLFQDIKQNGYKSQLDLNEGKLKQSIEDIDEISVNIDRNGEMLFNNSAHRLAMAKLLKVKKIPVIITMWHSESLGTKI